jgi:hypothetical protein
VTFSLVIYLLLGTTTTGIPVFDETNPIVVKNGMTEQDCSIEIEVLEDMQLFARRDEALRAKATGVTPPIYTFEPSKMAAYCEPES